ncbi:MAG: energy transducer TonB, partial [Carboxylicivirga sp.]|nr:energy transducer TonB [Carboxylicivirga sp.]
SVNAKAELFESDTVYYNKNGKAFVNAGEAYKMIIKVGQKDKFELISHYRNKGVWQKSQESDKVKTRKKKGSFKLMHYQGKKKVYESKILIIDTLTYGFQIKETLSDDSYHIVDVKQIFPRIIHGEFIHCIKKHKPKRDIYINNAQYKHVVHAYSMNGVDKLAEKQSVDEWPAYPGGFSQFMEDKQTPIMHLLSDIKRDLPDSAYLLIDINERGWESYKGIYSKLDKSELVSEDELALKSDIRWLPARQESRPVNFRYVIPIVIDNEKLQLNTQAIINTKINQAFHTVEIMPEFPGGKKALKNYLEKSYKYPLKAETKKIQGRVYLSFIIDKNGNTTCVKVERSLHPLLDSEAIRIVKAMPQWHPGIQKGKEVAVWYRLSVQFNLESYHKNKMELNPFN